MKKASAAPKPSAMSLGEWIRTEEQAAAANYMDMRPELVKKIFKAGSVASGNADSLGGTIPTPPLLNFDYLFPKLAKALASSPELTFQFSGGSGSPALVTKGDAKIAEVAARTNDCKTLRGALSLLEAQMA